MKRISIYHKYHHGPKSSSHNPSNSIVIKSVSRQSSHLCSITARLFKKPYRFNTLSPNHHHLVTVRTDTNQQHGRSYPPWSGHPRHHRVDLLRSHPLRRHIVLSPPRLQQATGLAEHGRSCCLPHWRIVHLDRRKLRRESERFSHCVNHLAKLRYGFDHCVSPGAIEEIVSGF